MKLRTISIFLTTFLSNMINVKSQQICPSNGITTNGICFYTTSENCPYELADEGVVRNELEFLRIKELLQKNAVRDRICMTISNLAFNTFLERKPYYMEKLKTENRILLDKPIEDGNTLHFVFKQEDFLQKSTITIGKTSQNDYICRIEIQNGKFTMSSVTEIIINPERVNFARNSGDYYDFRLEFSNGNILAIDSVKHKKIAGITPSSRLEYLANQIVFENVEFVQLEYHDITCESGETYKDRDPPVLLNNSLNSEEGRSFERSTFENFRLNPPTGVHKISPKPKGKWAENFMFHILDENHTNVLYFEMIFQNNAGERSMEYKIAKDVMSSNHPLTIAYQKRVNHGVVFDSWKYDPMKGNNRNILPPKSGLTFRISEEGHKQMKLSMETETWTETDIIEHPCTGNPNEDKCPFSKDIILIDTEHLSITGFRFIENEQIAKYCLTDYWMSNFSPYLVYQNDCGSKKTFNLCRIEVQESFEPAQTLSSEMTGDFEEVEEKFVEIVSHRHELDEWEILKKNNTLFATICFLTISSLLFSILNFCCICFLPKIFR